MCYPIVFAVAENRSNHSAETFLRFADNFPVPAHNQSMQTAPTIPGTQASAQNSPPFRPVLTRKTTVLINS
jgi:hypothetical protein